MLKFPEIVNQAAKKAHLPVFTYAMTQQFYNLMIALQIHFQHLTATFS